jgi:hypothetical protein
MKAGRPSDYNPKVAAEICERIADGETLTDICRDAKLPHRVTVWRWLKDNEEFAANHARAREIGGHWLEDKIAAEAERIVDAESATVATAKAKLYQWMAQVRNPRVYGAKTFATVDATVSKAKPISDEAALAEIAELSQQLGGRFQLVEVVDEDETEE